MMQLVELQEALPKFAEAGIKIYVISYDYLGALKDFAKHHNITYDLLADEDSAVIKRFGILNDKIPEEQVPYHGIPFPGTYLVDEEGLVSTKSFHRSLAHRDSPEALIDDALGELLLRSEDPSVGVSDDSGIKLSMNFHGGGGVLRGALLRRLIVRVELPDGLHIYDDPVPEGMVATNFTLAGPQGMRHLPVERPPTQPLELPGVGVLQVWSGKVDFVMSVWGTDEITSLVRGDAPDRTTIEVDIAYQTCDDSVCHLPQTRRLSLEVPIGRYVGPALRLGGLAGTEVTTMDTTRWLGAMVKRGMENTPDPEAAAAYLSKTLASFEAGPSGGQDPDSASTDSA